MSKPKLVQTVYNYRSDQMAVVADDFNLYRRGEVLEQHYDNNKVRCAHMSYTAPTGGIAQGSIIFMGVLGQGLILPNSLISSADIGGAGTFDLGFGAYSNNNGVIVPENTAALATGADASGQTLVGTLSTLGTPAAKLGYLLQGWAPVCLKLQNGGMQAGARIDLFMFYVNGQ